MKDGRLEGELRTQATLSDIHYRIVLRAEPRIQLLCVVAERRVGESGAWDSISSSGVEDGERPVDNIDLAVDQIAQGIAERAAAWHQVKETMSKPLLGEELPNR
jgi:hypothetical protein